MALMADVRILVYLMMACCVVYLVGRAVAAAIMVVTFFIGFFGTANVKRNRKC